MDDWMQDAAALWNDGAARRRVFDALLAAWVAGDTETLSAIITAVDRAVVERLAAHGLPGGVKPRVVLVPGTQSWLARWNGVTHELLIAADGLRLLLPFEGGYEAALYAWVHESLHARHPFANGA